MTLRQKELLVSVLLTLLWEPSWRKCDGAYLFASAIAFEGLNYVDVISNVAFRL